MLNNITILLINDGVCMIKDRPHMTKDDAVYIHAASVSVFPDGSISFLPMNGEEESEHTIMAVNGKFAASGVNGSYDRLEFVPQQFALNHYANRLEHRFREAEGVPEGHTMFELAMKYQESQGIKCPFCGETVETSGGVEVTGNEAIQPCSCPSCGREWNDVYVFNRIEPVSS